MDIAKGVCVKLKKILSKLKLLRIIRSYTYKVDFEKVDEDDRECLLQLDDLLGKCIQKICWRPRRAEIRNVIGELMRKKNVQRNFFNDFQEKNFIDERNNRVKKDEKSRRRLKPSKDSLLPGSNERIYLCEYCGRRFIHYSRMGSHILRIHKKENFTLDKEYELQRLTDKSDAHLNTDRENNDKCNFCSEAKLQGFNVIGKPCPHHTHSSESGNISGGITEGHRVPEGKGGTRNEETQVDCSKSYNCAVCHRNFRLKQSLRKHIRLKHGRESVINFPCSRCKQIFTERGKLNRHLLIHNEGEFECSQCSKSFHRMDNLRRHFSLIHQQLKSFICRFCQKGFSLKFNRDVHERNVHETGTEVECELCGKKCKNKTTFNEHKKIHEINPFTCSLCPKKFIRKPQYRKHLKSKHKGISPYQKLFDSIAKAISDSPT